MLFRSDITVGKECFCFLVVVLFRRFFDEFAFIVQCFVDEMPEWKITADSDEQTYFDLEYVFLKYERVKNA